MPAIILTRPWTDKAMAALRRDYEVILPDRDQLYSLPEGAEAFCPLFYDTVDRRLIAALPSSLKIIASFGAGVDHIDLEAAREKGLIVTNTPGVVSDDAADITIGLMISAMRGFSAGEKLLRDGNWRGAAMSGLVGRKVTGKTLGIVGLGRIGEKVARRARAFDMKILYFSRTRKKPLEKELGLTFVRSLEELVAISDVVSLHTPLIPQTHHLINTGILKKFKPGSFLINTGRGGLVDEKALVKALKAGPLAGAGLDVYEFEPKLAEGLQALENVTLLPHMGSATEETRTAMGLRVKENLDAYFSTGQVKDRVA